MNMNVRTSLAVSILSIVYLELVPLRTLSHFNPSVQNMMQWSEQGLAKGRQLSNTAIARYLELQTCILKSHSSVFSSNSFNPHPEKVLSCETRSEPSACSKQHPETGWRGPLVP